MFAYPANAQSTGSQLMREIQYSGSPGKVKIILTGPTGLKVAENGELKLMMKQGSGTFKKPFAYQIIGDEHKAVEVSYRIHKGTTYGFKLGGFDKSKPLMIRF